MSMQTLKFFKQMSPRGQIFNFPEVPELLFFMFFKCKKRLAYLFFSKNHDRKNTGHDKLVLEF